MYISISSMGKTLLGLYTSSSTMWSASVPVDSTIPSALRLSSNHYARWVLSGNLHSFPSISQERSAAISTPILKQCRGHLSIANFTTKNYGSASSVSFLCKIIIHWEKPKYYWNDPSLVQTYHTGRRREIAAVCDLRCMPVILHDLASPHWTVSFSF